MSPWHGAGQNRTVQSISHHQIDAVTAQRLNEPRDVAEVVAVVRISHDKKSSARLAKTAEIGGPVASLRFVDDACAGFLGDLGGSVGRAVVNDDHFTGHIHF